MRRYIVKIFKVKKKIAKKINKLFTCRKLQDVDEDNDEFTEFESIPNPEPSVQSKSYEGEQQLVSECGSGLQHDTACSLDDVELTEGGSTPIPRDELLTDPTVSTAFISEGTENDIQSNSNSSETSDLLISEQSEMVIKLNIGSLPTIDLRQSTPVYRTVSALCIKIELWKRKIWGPFHHHLLRLEYTEYNGQKKYFYAELLRRKKTNKVKVRYGNDQALPTTDGMGNRLKVDCWKPKLLLEDQLTRSLPRDWPKFAESIQQNYPKYNLFWNNCQQFCKSFVAKLLGNCIPIEYPKTQNERYNHPVSRACSFVGSKCFASPGKKIVGPKGINNAIKNACCGLLSGNDDLENE